MNGLDTGYNESEVVTALDKIVTSYDNLYDVLSIEVQKKFVDELANMWACSYAVEFFNNDFKPAFDDILNNINMTFENIVESITSAAQAWAQTGGGDFSHSGISLKTAKVDVSAIKENINGVRGINTNTQAIAARLQSISGEAEGALNDTITAVQNSGFIGGGMQENLISALTQIKTQLSEAITELNNSIQEYVNKTASEYEELASSTASAFSGE